MRSSRSWPSWSWSPVRRLRTRPWSGRIPRTGPAWRKPQRKVSMTFSENVGSGFVAVMAPDGSKVKTAAAAPATGAAADVAASDQRGRYTVAYRVVSDDGHPVLRRVHVHDDLGPDGQQHEAHVPASTQRPFVDRHRGVILVDRSGRSVAGDRLGPDPVDRGGRSRVTRTVRLVLAGFAAGLVVMVVSLEIGGGAPEPSPAGIPDPGLLVGWALPAVSFLTQALGRRRRWDSCSPRCSCCRRARTWSRGCPSPRSRSPRAGRLPGRSRAWWCSCSRSATCSPGR